MPNALDCVFTVPRVLVSQNKRRFQNDGFNLDLCYIHPRIIVMGYPAVGMEMMYRNPRAEVRRLLEERHAGLYHVYNFCSEPERCYDPGVFSGRVKRYPIEDHNVPTLDQMVEFCEDAGTWLNSNTQHVVALHCKAGKGRAGMMACMLMLYMGFSQTATEAIQQYNELRVTDRRGLTVVSQRKWVGYAELLFHELRDGTCPRPIRQPTYSLRDLTICNYLTGVPPPSLRLRVYTLTSTPNDRQMGPILDEGCNGPLKKLVHQQIGTTHFELNQAIQGSVLVEFVRIRCGRCMPLRHFKLWFNTRLIKPDESGRVVFARSDMDWMSKDRKHRKFPAAFELQMRVE